MKPKRLEILGIVLITLTALALRLWRISEYLTFLGDEGRDVRIVRDLLAGNLVFIGPQTSIGNMYLGPLYYYMMAPFLWLSRLDPTGPAVMMALISTLTIVFIWYVGRSWFSLPAKTAQLSAGPAAGLIASLLFALSPVAIIYGRTSWNPNPMPFFALLAIFGLWQVWRHHRPSWLIISAASLAFALQMHYLGILLIPVLLLFAFLSRRHLPLKYTLTSLLVFFLLMSPLLLFDLKHDWQNFNAFKAFFTDRQITVNLNPVRSDRFLPVLYKLTDDLILSTSGQFVIALAWAFLLLGLFFLIRTHRRKKPYLLLAAWFGFGWLGLGIYKQHVYAHYFGFLLPAVYLLLGFIFSRLKFIGYLALTGLVYLAIAYTPLRQAPNRQLQRTEQVVDFIIEKSEGREFNFALIAKQNYDESYRYFLENKEARFFRGEQKHTDQLFVVCEDGDACQPEGHPQWQIAVFGPADTVGRWQIDHLKIYKLIPKETKNP